MKRRVPAEVFPPGDRLKEELEARGWTQGDLAEILGRPPRLVSEIITAKRAITPETAHGLSYALGTSAELWMNLESQYQLARTSLQGDAVERRASIYGQFPVKEMQKRGWLKPAASLDAIERELKAYFGVASLDEGISIAHAAKKTSYDKTSMLQAAWLMRALQMAPAFSVGKYSAANLPVLYAALRACVAVPADVAKVPSILSEFGVRLLIIAPLPGSKIDGACMWFEHQPLIALTLRYDRHDIFWHALFHELDHIENNEGKDEAIVDSNLLSECSHGATSEKRANQHAASRLIPFVEFERFVSQAKPYFAETAILDFAAQMNVHPGIVVGQLQHHQLLPWSANVRLKSRIREFIAGSAASDGF